MQDGTRISPFYALNLFAYALAIVVAVSSQQQPLRYLSSIDRLASTCSKNFAPCL